MRSTSRLFAPVLIGMLLLPAVLAGLGLVPNDLRIDSTIEPPGFEPGRLLDENYYREIDEHVTQSFAGRGAGQWLQAQIDYGVFGQVVHPDVERGPGDWLQLVASVRPPCDVLARIGDRTVDAPLQDRVSFAVLAEKSDIHPQSTFPDDVAPCVAAEREEWKSRTSELAEYLDVNSALTRAAADSDELLFYEQDMHWTQTGRLLVAEEVVDHFSPGLWDQQAVEPVEPIVRDMDVLRLMGLKRDGVLVDRAVVRDGAVTVDRIEFVESQSVYFPLAQISRSTATEVVPGTTWILGDSQFGYLLYELEPYFEELVFVNWLQIFLDPAVIDDLPDPEQILFSGVEPNAPTLFDLPFVDETIARLSN